MWFGTKDGLNRFDGYTFKIFRNKPDDSTSIGNNFIHSIYEDVNGIIYVGTESGLYRYNQTTESFTEIPTPTAGRIRDIKKDGKGILWYIVDFKLTSYNERTRKLRSFDFQDQADATSICISKDGALWTSTSTGILKKYDNKLDNFISYNVFEHSKPTVSKWIDKIHYSANNYILIGTSIQGVKLFNIEFSSYQDVLTYNSDKTEIFARNFFEAQKDEIWIATETGVYIYNLHEGPKAQLQKKLSNPYSLSDNAVYAFWLDREGGMWVCTYFGGINYFPKQHTPFEKYFPKIGENSLSGNVVREIHQDSYGTMWIGTEDAGINKYEVSAGKFTNFQATGNKSDISYNNIHGILVDGDKLWVGTFEHGLDVLNIKTGKVTRHYSMGSKKGDLRSNFIYSISKLNTGEIVLATTRGAFTYNNNSDDFSILNGMPENRWYTSIIKDYQGTIWGGTYGNGVDFYDTNKKKSGNLKFAAADPNSLSSDRVNCIYEDSKKDLWFATEGGLCRLNRSKNCFRRYTTDNGLPSNFILGILEDDNKNLWISTSKGLVRFSMIDEKVATYTIANGLLNNQFNFNSAFKDSNGKMYFGSVKGMISFNPRNFIENSFVPPVYITSFQVFNKELEIAPKGSPLTKSITSTEHIVLNYDQSTINIGFAALGFTAPSMAEYAYKMEGLDKRWTYLKQNRFAYFTKLAPGSYVFKVKATNSSGIWNEKETSLIIEILPPWWAGTTAYAVYTIAALLIIFLLFSYYHRSLDEKNRRKFQMLEIAKDKEIFKAKIDFFTNVAHEIRTPLTLIKGPLEKIIKKSEDFPEIKNNLKIMERNTNRLVDLTNQLLDFRQTEIEGFRLSFVKVNISEMLQEMYYNFKSLAEQKNLDFTLKIPQTEIYASVDLDAFNKILSNLLSNAVKYAETKVKVSLWRYNEDDNLFTIEVKNDGYLIPSDMKEKIFEPFFRLKETQKQKGTGIGLALSRSLVQLHKGSLDLKEPEEKMNIFSLTLPIQQEAEIGESVKTGVITIE